MYMFYIGSSSWMVTNNAIISILQMTGVLQSIQEDNYSNNDWCTTVIPAKTTVGDGLFLYLACNQKQSDLGDIPEWSGDGSVEKT